LNVHAVDDVRHTKMHTAETLILEPGSFDVEIVIEKI
jgi:hypothetical protein